MPRAATTRRQHATATATAAVRPPAPAAPSPTRQPAVCEVPYAPSVIRSPDRHAPDPWAQELATARLAARAAAAVARHDFGAPATVEDLDGVGNFTTPADVRADRAIRDILARRHPQDPVWTEAAPPPSGAATGDGEWVVDPLDGTHNHRRGIPWYTASVAFRAQGELVVGAVCDHLGREFAATVAAPHPPTAAPVGLDRAMVAVATDYTPQGRVDANHVAGILGGRVERVTQLCAPALDLAMLAAGLLDGMVCLSTRLVDCAAGLVLVGAAGGVILALDGGPFTADQASWDHPVRFIAAATPDLATDLVALLAVGQPAATAPPAAGHGAGT